MSKLNHRRRNPDSYPEHLANGYGPPEAKPWRFIDKSMHGWGTSRTESAIADRSIHAGITNDFTDGHRGMARAVKGAKKFVRTRFRFHAKTQLCRKATQEGEE
jgi:hypothetical protein